MKVLFLGEIVGKAGIYSIRHGLKNYCKDNKIDLVIANGEGATGGFGLGFRHSLLLLNSGIDIITLGEKAFFKKDMVEGIDHKDRILRADNYPYGVPGKGSRFYSADNKKVFIINLLGNGGFRFPHLTNPFSSLEHQLEKVQRITPYIFVVFHASPSAERVAMGFFLDGKVSAVCGTHTKVLTSDNCILPKGTSYISDLGRCGSEDSVGGFEPDTEIWKLKTQRFARSKECWDNLQIQGLLCNIGKDGLSEKEPEIVRINIPTPEREVIDVSNS